MRKRWPADEEILTAIVALADDGFCNRRDLVPLLGIGERTLRKSISRTVRHGLVLERRVKGSTYLALSSEGWQSVRSGESSTEDP